jgi:hypothetical protein
VWFVRQGHCSIVRIILGDVRSNDQVSKINDKVFVVVGFVSTWGETAILLAARPSLQGPFELIDH